MTTEFQYDVFLSHNQADKPRVRRLAERLRAAGLRVWFDEWVIQPGDDIYLAIERGLEASRTLVLCLSPAALGSDWVGLAWPSSITANSRRSCGRMMSMSKTCRTPNHHPMSNTFTRILVSALALVSSLLQAAEPARILIVVGPSNHPPGTHEVAAGGRGFGIVWTAKLDVPADGVKTAPPDLAAFKPESLTPQPSPKKAQPAAAKASPATADISRAELLDRIHGGWAGMLIGGLEGLPHEFKYKEQPRDTLPEFTFLEKGARSDDDNDFEWPHLFFMDKEGTLKLPYPRIVEIWKANMNSGIWVANKKARELMDQGVVPPETGSVARNPAAWYNLSGQFCVESYGLIAPGMPQTAADIGLHYTRIAVSEEPLQAAQFWSSLISPARVSPRAHG